MKPKLYLIIASCSGYLVAGCSTAQDAVDDSDCMKSAIYPIVTTDNASSRTQIDNLATQALFTLDLEQHNERFYFSQSTCYVQLEWESNTKLVVQSYVNDATPMSAADFSEAFQEIFNSQLRADGLEAGVKVSEEILLQE